MSAAFSTLSLIYCIDSLDSKSPALAEKLSLQKICLDLGISKNKLYEISNKRFNMPIGSYISHLRVLGAKNLLTSSSLSVREVSEQVGFEGYNYFIKLFKNNVGETPLKYRNRFPFNLHE